nr:MAG TPA: hypothetical protein [Crassvirales sp.]
MKQGWFFSLQTHYMLYFSYSIYQLKFQTLW